MIPWYAPTVVGIMMIFFGIIYSLYSRNQGNTGIVPIRFGMGILSIGGVCIMWTSLLVMPEYKEIAYVFYGVLLGGIIGYIFLSIAPIGSRELETIEWYGFTARQIGLGFFIGIFVLFLMLISSLTIASILMNVTEPYEMLKNSIYVMKVTGMSVAKNKFANCLLVTLNATSEELLINLPFIAFLMATSGRKKSIGLIGGIFLAILNILVAMAFASLHFQAVSDQVGIYQIFFNRLIMLGSVGLFGFKVKSGDRKFWYFYCGIIPSIVAHNLYNMLIILGS